jgi:hypothetical protein
VNIAVCLAVCDVAHSDRLWWKHRRFIGFLWPLHIAGIMNKETTIYRRQLDHVKFDLPGLVFRAVK